MKPRRPRLTAETLARLLGVATIHGLEPACLFLARHSPRGAVLLEQLCELREQVGRRVSWPYLADLMAAVDRLAGQLDVWTLPALMLDFKAPPLAHLHAAAQVRASDRGGVGRVACQEVAARLGKLLEKELEKNPGRGRRRKVQALPSAGREGSR